MSWIFTIVFSGILFSSSPAPAVDKVGVPQEVAAAQVERGDETERFEQTYPLTSGGRVSVSNVNGSVVVEAWDRNEVQLVAIKTAESKERLQDVEVRVNARPDSISIETNYDRWRQDTNGDRSKNGNSSRLKVDYQLKVPRGAVLNEIETVNGDVTVSNFTNVVKVSTVNGKVIASKLRGTSNLSTVNGEVSADFGSIDATSKINLSAVNGKVNLVLPSDANATVKADSLNGVIENDFGLPVRKGKYVGRDLYGKLGNGEARIKLDSVNGGLKVSRQNDGKSPSQVTDLLPKKTSDDDDNWDKDDDGNVSLNAKANKEIAKAVKDSQKKVSVAMSEAQREMQLTHPVIAQTIADSARLTAETVRRSVNVVDSIKIQQSITDGLTQQAANIAKIADAMYFPSMPRAERKTDTFPVKGIPKVTVEAHQCSLKITGWDRPEVKYVLSRSSLSGNRSPLSVKETHDESNVTIGVDGSGDNDKVRIEVFVPRKSNLKVKTDSEIRLEGVSGEMELIGQEEPINVRDADGKLTVTTTSGRVRVVGFRGDVRSQTGDGETMLEGDFANVNAKADTGSVVLTIPQEYAANINCVSPRTDVEDLDLTLVRDKDGSRDYRLGNGGAKVKIVTSGDVLIRSPKTITTAF